ncbi:hypothetical protein [Alistipes putredinis]|jgi:hypothetical protein|uniref:hypothetical protein n=1 Tax=Alistipes putredinis TaxID=28117 RepID=UPI003AB7ED19
MDGPFDKVPFHSPSPYLCFISSALVFPYGFIPQARLFSLQISIAGYRFPSRIACACWRKIFLPEQAGERISRILLARPGRQSRGQKNNQPSGTEMYRRENKKSNLKL